MEVQRNRKSLTWARAIGFVSVILLIGLMALPVFSQGGTPLLIINQVDSESFPDVTVRVAVSDASGLPIAGLTKADFNVTEDGTNVTGVEVSSDPSGRQALALVLALDVSGSMKGEPLAHTKEAAKLLVDSLGAQDSVALIAFDERVTMTLDFTSNKDEMKSAIDLLQVGGNTAFNDAVYDAVRKVSRWTKGRRAVAILTDGKDTGSNITQDDAIAKAQAANVPVYTIGFGNKVDQKALGRIAKLAGGHYYAAPSPAELTSSFQSLAQLLRHEYALSFHSRLPADNQEHELVIRIRYLGQEVGDKGRFVARPREVAVTLLDVRDGDTVGGLLSLAPEIVSPADLRQVEFFLDGELLATATAPPWRYDWDSTKVEPGNHSLTIEATDQAGNVGQIELNVSVEPPVVVQLTSPADGGKVDGEVPLAADVSALGQVASVEFWLDDEKLTALAAPPYELTLDTVRYPAGEHTVKVVAYDVSGQSAEDSITLDIQLRAGQGALLIALVIVVLVLALIFPIAIWSRRRTTGRGQRSRAAPAVAVPSSRQKSWETPAPTPAASKEGRAAPGAAEKVATAWLVVERGSSPGHRYPVGEGETTLGRSRANNDIPLEGRSASRRHAVIQAGEGRFVYYDLSKTNPTVINGRGIAGYHELQEGDRIEVGDMVLLFTTKKEMNDG